MTDKQKLKQHEEILADNAKTLELLIIGNFWTRLIAISGMIFGLVSITLIITLLIIK